MLLLMFKQTKKKTREEEERRVWWARNGEEKQTGGVRERSRQRQKPVEEAFNPAAHPLLLRSHLVPCVVWCLVGRGQTRGFKKKVPAKESAGEITMQIVLKGRDGEGGVLSPWVCVCVCAFECECGGVIVLPHNLAIKCLWLCAAKGGGLAVRIARGGGRVKVAIGSTMWGSVLSKI